MTQVQRIVVGVDGSALGRAAFAYATQLARAADVPLLGVTALEQDTTIAPLPIPADPFLTGAEGALPVVDWERIRTDALAELNELGQYADEQDLIFDGVCKEGRFVDVLRGLVRPTDLVVVGAQGRFRRAGFGSTTKALMKEALGGLMIVPAPLRPLERVIAISDGTEMSDHAVNWARSLAEQTGWPLSIGAVCHDHHDSIDDILQRAQDLVPDAQVIHLGRSDDSEAKQIERIASLSRMTVLVMGAYPDHPLHRLIFGGTTDHVLTHIDDPLILVR